MKTLGATELSTLRGFVRDVLNTIRYDDTGATDDLYDPAMNCAQILDIVEAPFEDDDEYDTEEDWYPDYEDDA